MSIYINTGPGNHDKSLFQQLSKNKVPFRYTSYWPGLKFGQADINGNIRVDKHGVFYDKFNYLIWGLWNKLPGINKKNYHLYYLFSLFDYLSSRNIHNEKLLIGWSQMSLRCIKKIKGKGGVSILEHPMPHAEAWMEYVSYEYEHFGKGIKHFYSLFTAPMIDRMLKEYKEADFINVLSSFSKEGFIKKGIQEEKLLVTPLGIDTEFFRPSSANSKSKKFKILFVGRMELWKGVHYLLQAFSELKLPDAELMLAGRLLPELEPHFKKYSGNFNYLGTKNPEELAKLYQEVDLFVLPSVQEAFGLVILEAMASGKPVIATENSAGPDIITDGEDGSIVPIRNISALKEKMLWYYENQTQCKEMGVEARNKVMSNYTLDHYGERMIRLIESCMTKGNRRVAV